jgi:hypothetical protein
MGHLITRFYRLKLRLRLDYNTSFGVVFRLLMIQFVQSSMMSRFSRVTTSIT